MTDKERESRPKELRAMDTEEFLVAVMDDCVDAFYHGGLRGGPGMVIVDRRARDEYTVSYQSIGQVAIEGTALEHAKSLIDQTVIGWPEIGITTMVLEPAHIRVMLVVPPWDTVNRAKHRFTDSDEGAKEYRQGGARWER